MREANYASLDAFRSAIRGNPFIADYVCDLLIARGVVVLRDDGSVVGVAGGSGGRALKSEPGDKRAWKDHWPDRGELIEAVRANYEDGMTFGEIQQHLKEFGEPCSHWIILHGLWNLIAANVVEKFGKKYRLTASGEVSHPAIYKVITEALKKAGEPYEINKVMAEIKAVPGHNFFGKHSSHTSDPTTQEKVDTWVEFRKKEGLL